MSVQYKTSVIWDKTLVSLELIEDNAITREAKIAGLVQKAVKITTGAPAATPGKFIGAARVYNEFDSTNYENTGTTASPVWGIMSAGTAQVKIQFEDQNGAALGTPGTVNEFEITGPSVTAVRAGDKVTYTISALAGPAPSPYSLGVAAGFSLLSGGTFTVSNPGLVVPTGDATATSNVNAGNSVFTAGSFIVGPTAPQTAAVLALYNQLKALPATNAVDLSTGNLDSTNIGYGLGVFVPGVYKSTAAVTTSGASTITLSGAGDYIFNIADAMTTGAVQNIILTNGAVASRVFFVVGTVTGGSSLTLGATGNLVGNFILGNGAGTITVGSTVSLQGRLLTTATQPIVIDGNASGVFLPFV